MGGAAIEVTSLRHTYRRPEGEITVLDDLTLVVEEGGYLSVTGPSGAGKSTLLSVIGGLERPQSGTVRVGDVDVSSLKADDLAGYRRDTVGFVFQHFGLLETLSAVENVELACSLNRVPMRARRARALELLDSVGLGARAEHRPLQLSGGERQRVAIARALANGPAVVLADEPTGNLDEDSTASVVGLLEDVRRAIGCTLVIVTHDERIARRAPQRLYLRNGRALQEERRRRAERPLRAQRSP